MSRFSALTRSSSSSIGSHEVGAGKPPLPRFTAVSHACFRLKVECMRRVKLTPPLSPNSGSLSLSRDEAAWYCPPPIVFWCWCWCCFGGLNLPLLLLLRLLLPPLLLSLSGEEEGDDGAQDDGVKQQHEHHTMPINTHFRGGRIVTVRDREMSCVCRPTPVVRPWIVLTV